MSTKAGRVLWQIQQTTVVLQVGLATVTLIQRRLIVIALVKFIWSSFLCWTLDRASQTMPTVSWLKIGLGRASDSDDAIVK